MALIPSPPSNALLQQNSHKNQGRESRDIHFKMSYDLHKKYDIFPHSRCARRDWPGPSHVTAAQGGDWSVGPRVPRNFPLGERGKQTKCKLGE